MPHRYEKKQKGRVAGSKQEKDTHMGQCEAATDWHIIHRRLFILSFFFFAVKSGETVCWAWVALMDGDPVPVVSLWLLPAASVNIFYLSIPIKLNKIFRWVQNVHAVQKDVVCSKAKEALKHLLWVRKWKISTRHNLDKKRNSKSVWVWGEIVYFLCSPTGAHSQHKDKHSWHTDTCTHMETVWTEHRVLGWRFCWARSSKQCRCLTCLFPFSVMSRAPRWGQRFDGSHSDIRVGCSRARDPGVLQDTLVQSAVCTQLCYKQLK